MCKKTDTVQNPLVGLIELGENLSMPTTAAYAPKYLELCAMSDKWQIILNMARSLTSEEFPL